MKQAAGTFTTVASNTGTSSTTYVDNSVQPETRYAYRVKAINSAGVSAQSGYVNVSTSAVPATPSPTAAPTAPPPTAAPTVAPTAAPTAPPPTAAPTVEPTPVPTASQSVPARPTGLIAASVSHDSVTLIWDDPDDGSITGYQVLRRSRDRLEYGDGQVAAGLVAVVDDTDRPQPSTPTPP